MPRRREYGGPAQYAVILLIAVSLNFALPRVAPGDPLEFFVGEDLASLTADERARFARELGLDRPVLVQYRDYLAGIAVGDLGRSFRFGAEVTDILGDRLRWSLLLILPALVFSFVIGTVLGALAAWRRQRTSDMPLLVGVLAADALPPFWVGMVLIAVFAGWLGWLPAFGALGISDASGALGTAGDLLRRLAMPVATLTFANVPHIFLIARASLLTTLGQDYVALAEAKGLSERGILFRHALRNALLPLYTHAALSLGALTSGAVLVETVFGYPGLGRLLTEAVAMRDYPLLQGGFLLVTVGVIGANAVADLTYPWLDPRLRRAR